jgi:Dictyostelium (slime mold) repeat
MPRQNLPGLQHIVLSISIFAAAAAVWPGCGTGEPEKTFAVDSSAQLVTVTCKGNGTLGRACDDGNPCTHHDVCTRAGCVGTPYTCDDGNVCTSDKCDGNGGCIFTATSGNKCDDGNPCTSNDTCSGGVCAGAGYSCDDGNACTADACDGKGGCSHVALSGTACEDGDLCTVGDVCVAGVCTAGQPLDCDDGNPATSDSCQSNGTCVHLVAGPIASCPEPENDCFNICMSANICDFTSGCCVSSCGDGLMNSSESDIDCGGGCPQCEDGKMCWGSYDCVSNNCVYAPAASKGTCMP